MAGVAAVNAVFQFKTIDLSPYLHTVKVTRTVTHKPSGAFGTIAQTFVETTNEFKFAITGFFDKAATATDKKAYDAVGAGSGLVEFWPESSAAGLNVKYSGYAVLTKHEDDSGWDNLVMFSADFQGTGTLTRSLTA